jgi:16S rRNA (uracil1498-N3)-methyltransferase
MVTPPLSPGDPVALLPDELRRAPLVFVNDLDVPEVGDADRHHLQRVLRLRPGGSVCLGDGGGRWRTAVWRGTTGGGAGVVADLGEVRHMVRVAPELTVGVALAKGSRTEWMVQKLTEVGVDRIVLLVTDRGVVRWESAEHPRRLGRLDAVVRSAASQSRRVWLPELVAPVPVAAVGGPEGVVAGPVAACEPGGEPLSLAYPTVLVGPEGGFTAQELGAVDAQVGLGLGILRVETAALAAGVLLATQRGQMAT